VINELPVVVLAGGLGTRLKQVNPEIPKILVNVAGKPFIEWKIEELELGGATKIYFLLGHGGEQVFDYLNSRSFKTPIACIPEGSARLGTLGALKSAVEFLPPTFVLTYGDNLLDEPLHDFFPPPKGVSNVMVVTNEIGKGDKGNVILSGDKVVKYEKESKEQCDFLDYGYSVLSRSTIESLEIDYPIDLSFLFHELIKLGILSAHVTAKRYHEIGSPNTLIETSEHLRSR
jgi:NDP-sugar pyrophosphorylase family protein